MKMQLKKKFSIMQWEVDSDEYQKAVWLAEEF